MGNEELNDGMYVKGEIRKIFTKVSDNKEIIYSYKVLCDDCFHTVKSKGNSLSVGDTFFASVRVQPYDFVDEKTGERKIGNTLWEVNRV